jgi:23S rRNA (cytidine1920-2'-O)/16S rRNA (cytidine1409-2'-O)-methyltransferase
LHQNSIELTNKIALDVGSSTGGFTEVLLCGGVSSVDCVDVGSGQLYEKIYHNPKVTSYENTDIREFNTTKRYDIVVCDVSFIAIKNIISSLDNFFSQDLILLYKPQFEVGALAKRDRRGVVTDTQQLDLSQQEFEYMTCQLNWNLVKKQNSQISGKRGNIETFYWFQR